MTVDKQRCVVALEDVFDDRQARGLKDPLLGVRLIEYAIKVKLMDLILIVKGDSPIDNLQALLRKLIPHGPDPNISLNLLLLLLSLRLFLLHYCNSINYKVIQ